MEANRRPRAVRGADLWDTREPRRLPSLHRLITRGEPPLTVMIDSFFGVHPYLLRCGLWREMKPGEKDLYLYIMEESERCCTREIRATDAQVRDAVGAASRTLCNARKKLREHGLIRYKAGQGNRYIYVICDPKTGLPYPGDPRTPIVVPKRERAKEASLSHSGALLPPPPKASPESNRYEPKGPESYGLPGVF
jgi:hypothetical protein